MEQEVVGEEEEGQMLYNCLDWEVEEGVDGEEQCMTLQNYPNQAVEAAAEGEAAEHIPSQSNRHEVAAEVVEAEEGYKSLQWMEMEVGKGEEKVVEVE